MSQNLVKIHQRSMKIHQTLAKSAKTGEKFIVNIKTVDCPRNCHSMHSRPVYGDLPISLTWNKLDTRYSHYLTHATFKVTSKDEFIQKMRDSVI